MKRGRFPSLFSRYKIIVGDEIPLEETEKSTREQWGQLDEKVLCAIQNLKEADAKQAN